MHHYGVWTIHIAVAFVLEGLSSFRGAARNLALLSRSLVLKSPSYSSIRQWVLRVGLYELQRPREKRNDWLFILDLTIELGATKCLAILGIPQARWQQWVEQGQGALSYQQLEVLGMEVMSSTKGELIHQAIEKTSAQVGEPLQIVSDHGSDLKKGIHLYHQAHPQVHLTYDVTHQSARLLKGELELDETYQAFASRCARTRQQLQQSRLSFLMPPVQRAKARYFNVDTLLEWAKRVLAYQQRQDFSLINLGFCLDQLALDALACQLNATMMVALYSLKNQLYPNRQALLQTLQRCLEPKQFSEFAASIAQQADLGRRYFEQKLGWLQTYHSLLQPYLQMLALVRTLQRQIKHQGLTQQSKSEFIAHTQAWELSPRLECFQAKLLAYLERETAALPSEKPLLGSSDIIESIFGSYKLFSDRSPLKHMGYLILTLPLLTANLSVELIEHAMRTVSFAAVKDWYAGVFGLSPLAKRRAALRRTTADTELA